MYQAISKIPVLVLTVVATSTVEMARAVDIDGTVTSAGDAMLGLSDTRGFNGDELAVDVMGTSTATAGAAITAGALLQVGNDGKLITKAAGITVARALTDASGDGSMLEVLLLPANT